MDEEEREELEAFARIEWPGVLVRMKRDGATEYEHLKLPAERLEEFEARWLAKYPPLSGSSTYRPSSALRTGAGTGRRKQRR